MPTSNDNDKKELTPKQLLFVEHYIRAWNGTCAARRAGYKGTDGTLASVAFENLRKPHIRARIQERLEEAVMTSNEVLARLAEMASVSMNDFIKKGEFGWSLDLNAIKKKGHLIKKLWETRDGTRIELHDSQTALVNLGKHYGIFQDKLDLTAALEIEGISGITDEQLIALAGAIIASRESDPSEDN